jgi:hypothetical protein
LSYSWPQENNILAWSIRLSTRGICCEESEAFSRCLLVLLQLVYWPTRSNRPMTAGHRLYAKRVWLQSTTLHFRLRAISGLCVDIGELALVAVRWESYSKPTVTKPCNVYQHIGLLAVRWLSAYRLPLCWISCPSRESLAMCLSVLRDSGCMAEVEHGT